MNRKYLSEITSNSWLDWTGAAASWLCLAHCVLLPMLASALPFIGLSFLADEATENVFIGSSVLIAVSSLLPAYFRKHRKIRAIILFVSGLGLIISSHFAFEDDLVLQIPFLFMGAVFVTASHLINRRLCRKCVACSET